MLVDHLLLIDQMVNFAHQIHQLVNAVRPIIEHFIGILGHGKVDYANGAIDFSPNSLGNDQRTEGFLSFLGKKK